MAGEHGYLQRQSWPVLRALLISLALSSQCVSAIPTKPLNERVLSRPENARITGWAVAALASLGVRWSRDEMDRALVGMSTDTVQWRHRMLELIGGGGLSQQWGLFLMADDHAHRLQVEVRRPVGDWVSVYRVNQQDLLGLAPLLDYRRMRGLYNPKPTRERRSYQAFARWLAADILRANPEYEAVRISVERMQVATRADPSRLLETSHAVEHTRAVEP